MSLLHLKVHSVALHFFFSEMQLLHHSPVIGQLQRSPWSTINITLKIYTHVHPRRPVPGYVYRRSKECKRKVNTVRKST